MLSTFYFRRVGRTAFCFLVSKVVMVVTFFGGGDVSIWLVDASGCCRLLPLGASGGCAACHSLFARRASPVHVVITSSSSCALFRIVACRPISALASVSFLPALSIGASARCCSELSLSLLFFPSPKWWFQGCEHTNGPFFFPTNKSRTFAL